VVSIPAWDAWSEIRDTRSAYFFDFTHWTNASACGPVMPASAASAISWSSVTFDPGVGWLPKSTSWYSRNRPASAAQYIAAAARDEYLLGD
jgi:hypothetical protein